jgi:hypothetical protein
LSYIPRIAALFVPAVYLATTVPAWGAEPTATAEAPAAAPGTATTPEPEPSAPAIGAAEASAPSAVVANPNDATAPSLPASATPAANQTANAAQPPPPPRADEGPVTLFGSHPKLGGFGGISVGYTRFADRDGGQFCLEGGIIIDRSLSLGAKGCGIAPNVRTTSLDATANPDYRTAFGYGGAVIRYHLPYKFFNFALGALVGAGDIATGDWDDSYNHHHHDDWDGRHDLVFVVEPHASAYVNMVRWLRLGVTGGYRFVTGVDTIGLKASDVAGPTVGFEFQAGWF